MTTHNMSTHSSLTLEPFPNYLISRERLLKLLNLIVSALTSTLNLSVPRGYSVGSHHCRICCHLTPPLSIIFCLIVILEDFIDLTTNSILPISLFNPVNINLTPYDYILLSLSCQSHEHLYVQGFCPSLYAFPVHQLRFCSISPAILGVINAFTLSTIPSSRAL